VRHCSIVLAAALVAATLPFAAGHAQEGYPSRTITLVVPYPAGGFVDVTARHLAEGLREKLGQSVVVTNRPGANGKVALGELVRTAPDGYTLLLNNDGGIGIPPAVDPQFKFEVDKDYTAIAQVADAKYVITTSANLPVKSMAELIDYARANPGKLTFGSPGLGTTPHLAMEQLMRQTGTKMVHAPYPGGAPAATDLLKGQIDLLVNAMPGLMGFIGSDKLRMLAVLSDTRAPQMPEVPTISESGLKPIRAGGWLGLFGPPGMSKDLLTKISNAVGSVTRDPAHAERLRKAGAEATFQGIDTFPDRYRSEVGKWKAFAQEHGFRLGQ
jgi:tripartite-type tricarboxylate transporter receptor subunit TctC